MPVCKLVSRTTGEQHYASANGDPLIVLNFQKEEILVTTRVKLVDRRGPWIVYVDDIASFWIPGDFKTKGNVHQCTMPRFSFTFEEPSMSLKQVEAARAAVEALEGRVRMLREERVNKIVDVLAGDKGVDAEEIYEFRNELASLFESWRREDV